MHGLHIAFAACRKQKGTLVREPAQLKQTLQQTSAQHMLEVMMAKEERDTIELSLELRLEVANNMLRTYEEREERETRSEQSLQIRKELCDVSEAAARDRINSLEDNLSSALRRVREHEDHRMTMPIVACKMGQQRPEQNQQTKTWLSHIGNLTLDINSRNSK